MENGRPSGNSHNRTNVKAEMVPGLSGFASPEGAI